MKKISNLLLQKNIHKLFSVMRDALHFLLINYIVHFLVLMTFEACLTSPVSLVICTTICRVWEAWQKIFSFQKKYSCIYEFPRDIICILCRKYKTSLHVWPMLPAYKDLVLPGPQTTHLLINLRLSEELSLASGGDLSGRTWTLLLWPSAAPSAGSWSTPPLLRPLLDLTTRRQQANIVQ